MAVRATRSTSRASKSHKMRKMKEFHPRRSTRSMKLSKQKLSDIEHKMSADIGSLLVLLEEGSATQVLNASQKAKSDYLKYAPDMAKLATDMGGAFPRYVGEFLHSVDNILHTGVNWIDDAKIKECYEATKTLEDALRIASKR